MIIYAVYIVGDDGRTLLAEYFQSTENLPDSVLVGGLFTALQGFSQEVLDGSSGIKTLEIDNVSYHVKSFGLYRIIIVTNTGKEPDSLLQMLGLRFMKQFGEALSEALADNIKIFEPFRDIIKEIIDTEIIDKSGSIKPSKMLSTSEIFNLDPHLHDTALAMLSLEEATVTDIVRETEQKREKIKNNLAELVKAGYLGIREGRNKKSQRFFIHN